MKDPIQLFAHMLGVQNGVGSDAEEHNRKLLETLIQKGHISKTSIIWHDNKISKIYGFKIGDNGKIEYESPQRKVSPKKTTAGANAYVAVADARPQIDVLSLQNAILRSKQMAI